MRSVLGTDPYSCVPIYSAIYGCSEGVIGINVNPDSKGYVLLPRAMFFEFIPEVDCDQSQPQVLFSDQLAPGQRYELVVTTLSGFCRYRLGDVIRLVGWYGTDTPVIEFLYRRGQLLSIVGEKITEEHMLAAFQSAGVSLNLLNHDHFMLLCSTFKQSSLACIQFR